MMETQQPITTDLTSADSTHYSIMTYSQPIPTSNTDGQSFNPIPVYQQNYTTPQQVYGTQDMNHNITNYSQGMDPYKPQYDYGQVSQSQQNMVYDNTDSGLGYESNGMVYNGDVSMNYYNNESGNQFTHSQVSQQGNAVASNHLAQSQSPTSPPAKRGPGRPTKKIFAPGKDKAYVCQTCFKPLGTYQSLRKHMVTHTGERQYRCHMCSNSYTQKHNLTKHLLVHSGEKPYSCQHCSAAYRTRHLLTNHMKRHQKYNTSIAGSPEVRSNTSSKLREMLINHSETMDTSFNHNESSLDSSTLTDTSAELNSPVSEMSEMNSSFKEMSPDLETTNQVPKTSLASKSEELNNKVVNKSNKSKSNTEPVRELEKGGNRIGAQSEKPNLECDKCEQVFESRIKFQRHKKEHNNSQKTLNCNFCNATFRWKAALDIHMRKHKGQKQPSYELKGLKIKNGNRITLKIGTSDKKEADSESSEKAAEVANSVKKSVDLKSDQKESHNTVNVNETVIPEKSAVKLGKKNQAQQAISNIKVSPKQGQNQKKVSDTPIENHETENHDTRTRKLSNRKHVENPYVGSMPRSEIARQPENQVTRVSNRAHKKPMDNSDVDSMTQDAETNMMEIQTQTGKPKRYECDLCGQIFTQNFSLKRHIRNKICTR